MKAKNNKGISIRVIINTALLIIMAVVFGVLTCWSAKQLKRSSGGYQGLSDAPHLCYRHYEEDAEGIKIIEGGYVCSSEIDEATNDWKELTSLKDYTLFLQQEMTFSSVMRAYDLMTVVMTIGAMFTIASGVGAIVYWNHNRIR